MRINDPRISPRENRAIDWEIVDIYLRKLKDRGSVKLLARRLGISRVALTKRRKELGLKSLPSGRNREVRLTKLEQDVFEAMLAGETLTMLARARGVTRSTMVSIANRAEQKKSEIAQFGCKECFGLGITACKSCDGIGPHHHVCLACGGNSTTWASQGLVDG